MPDIQLNDPTQVATLADDDLVAVIPGQADTDPDANPPEGITKANLTTELKTEGGFVTQTDIDDAVLIETTAREAEDTAIRTDLTALINAVDTSTNAQAIADLRTQVNGLNGEVESNTSSVASLQTSIQQNKERLQEQITDNQGRLNTQDVWLVWMGGWMGLSSYLTGEVSNLPVVGGGWIRIDGVGAGRFSRNPHDNYRAFGIDKPNLEVSSIRQLAFHCWNTNNKIIVTQPIYLEGVDLLPGNVPIPATNNPADNLDTPLGSVVPIAQTDIADGTSLRIILSYEAYTNFTILLKGTGDLQNISGMEIKGFVQPAHWNEDF